MSLISTLPRQKFAFEIKITSHNSKIITPSWFLVNLLLSSTLLIHEVEIFPFFEIPHTECGLKTVLALSGLLSVG